MTCAVPMENIKIAQDIHKASANIIGNLLLSTREAYCVKANLKSVVIIDKMLEPGYRRDAAQSPPCVCV